MTTQETSSEDLAAELPLRPVEATVTVENLLHIECEHQVALVRKVARDLEEQLRAEADRNKKLLERLME